MPGKKRSCIKRRRPYSSRGAEHSQTVVHYVRSKGCQAHTREQQKEAAMYAHAPADGEDTCAKDIGHRLDGVSVLEAVKHAVRQNSQSEC